MSRQMEQEEGGGDPSTGRPHIGAPLGSRGARSSRTLSHRRLAASLQVELLLQQCG